MLCSYPSLAQIKVNEKEHRILLVLNTSRSMASSWLPGQTRYTAATELITGLIDSIYNRNDQVEFALRAYGHQYAASENNCNDTRREVRFSKDNYTQVTLRLADLKPKGKGSLVNALNEATKSDIIDTQSYYYSLVVITDNSADCLNNVCESIPALLDKNLFYKKYILNVSSIQSNYPCFNMQFNLTNETNIRTTIERITSDFPRNRIKVYTFPEAAKKPKYTDEYRNEKPVQTKMAASLPNTSEIAIRKSDTSRTQTSAPVEETVVLSKKSKITTKEPDKFGYLKLMNLQGIPLIVLFISENEVYKEYENIFTVGMENQRIKLKTGNYKAAYYIGNYEVSKTFYIEEDMITDVRMQ
jgi:hypothetical protein